MRRRTREGTGRKCAKEPLGRLGPQPGVGVREEHNTGLQNAKRRAWSV